MANLKFYKGATTQRPTDVEAGVIFFDTIKRTINVKVGTGNGDSDWEAYSGVQSITYTDQKLTWVDVAGKETTLSFSDVASKTTFDAFATKTIATLGVIENDIAGLKENLADLTLLVTTVSNYILDDIEPAIAAEVTARASADTSLATAISSVSNAILNLDATVTASAGYMISKITQQDGKITGIDTRPVMDGLLLSLGTDNKLTIKNANTNATITSTVDLSILAQDKYISDVEYVADQKVLKFTWVEKNGTEKVATVPVGDLVDTYTQGSGIVIDNNKIGIESNLLMSILSIDNKIKGAIVTADVNARGYASSALEDAQAYVSEEITSLETTLKNYAQALVTWAVFS